MEIITLLALMFIVMVIGSLLSDILRQSLRGLCAGLAVLFWGLADALREDSDEAEKPKNHQRLMLYDKEAEEIANSIEWHCLIVEDDVVYATGFHYLYEKASKQVWVLGPQYTDNPCHLPRKDIWKP